MMSVKRVRSDPRTQEVIDIVTENLRRGEQSGIESKFLDCELTATALTTSWVSLNPTGTGCTDSISVPAEGTGEQERNGRNYVIDSIMIHGVFATAAAESGIAPQADFRARIILYWDRQTNSTEATATDIMNNALSNDILAFRNLKNTRRFIVLFDKTIQFKIGNSITNEGEINKFAVNANERRFEFYRRFKKGVKVQCDAGTANVSSVSDVNFGIAVIASNINLTPTVAYQTRVRFRG